ncbi:MAG: sensor histidine kinase [Christensenellales bacterium]
MRQTLTTRLIVTYLIIILLTISVLGFYFIQIYRKQSVEEQIVRIKLQAETVNNMAQKYFLGTVSKDEFLDEITTVASGFPNNQVVWVFDQSGFYWRVAGQGNDEGMDDENVSQVMKSKIDSVMYGSTVETVVPRGGEFTHDTLLVGIPIKTSKDEIHGAVFIHQSLQELEEAVYGVYRQVMNTLLIMILPTILILYIISKRISRPLVKMNQYAKEFAQGNFDKRVPVQSQDEIGQLAESFNSMAQDLQVLEDTRRSFVANVSHELKSPLTSVQGFVQAMLDGAIPPDKHEIYLEKVLAESKHMSQIVVDLLELAKMESGNFPLHMERFELNELIRRTLLTFENRIEQKKINVVLTLPDMPCYVMADSARITQVISNLVDNAIKFAYEGSQLKVWTHYIRDKVLVYVYNDGPRIPAEDLPYIWERFYMADKAHTRTALKGTGLGLSIVRRIMEQHGETIKAENVENKGVVFMLTLKKVK